MAGGSRYDVFACGNEYFTDTWIWNGDIWQKTDAVLPAGGRVVTYDSRRDCILLFNGTFALDSTARTWTWTEGAWVLRADGDGPETNGAMAYDAVTDTVVHYGGHDNRNFPNRETWAWDGTSWTRLSPLANPGYRKYGVMGSDGAGHVLLYGGVGLSSHRYRDTWLWNGTTWILADEVGPDLVSYRLVNNTDSGDAILVGHNPGTGDTETWIWNGSGWTLVARSGLPTGFYGFDVAFDSARSRVVLFGGRTNDWNDWDANCNGYLDDLWEWDGSRWSLLARPSARREHAMVFDPYSEEAILFGGRRRNVSNKCSADPDPVDTWAWNGQHWQLRAVVGPTPRHRHGMAFDIARGEAVLFGGWPYNAETWCWDGSQWDLRAESGPSPRDRPSLAFDEQGQHVLLFGGYNNGQLFTDTWQWDGAAWTQIAAEGPSLVSSAAMAYDPIVGQMVLFGFTGDESETWVWTEGAWSLVATGGPPATGRAKMAYDYTGRRILLFIGFDETWAWQDGQWIQLSAGNEWWCGDSWSEVVGDPVRGDVMLFGGNGVGGETWIWHSSLPCRADFDQDGIVNTQDVLAFLNAWVFKESSADFNQDGSVNTLDVLNFLNAWSAGC